MTVKLDDQEVTINRLRSDLAEQRDLVKEQKRSSESLGTRTNS